MIIRGLCMFSVLLFVGPLSACAAGAPADSAGDVESWEFDSELTGFRDTIVIYVNGEETAGGRFNFQVRDVQRFTGTYRGRDVQADCRRIPLFEIAGYECRIRVDGEPVASVQALI